METRFDHSREEGYIYEDWERSGYFSPDNLIKDGLIDKNAKPFSIILPPPNVTGTLHLGHASMLAIEDMLVRFNRLQGHRVLWVPGTDHAAIATQSKVEKDIYKKEGKNRHDLGREEFLARVRSFASASHDTITGQVKAMGSSIDWTREAYTLDNPRALAVNTAFKRMYDLDLIYRQNKVVNWCVKCGSTLSDDEVEHQEGEATLYTFRYDSSFPFAIATTRPETKLGDTAVAVHPKDKRYQKYVGQTFSVNFCGVDLNIKIIADNEVNPDFGTGALGVTPAHSRADEDLATKHNLPAISIIDELGKMNSNSGPFTSLKVKAAREEVVSKLLSLGLIDQEEKISQNLSVCYRCGSPVEPLPKKQWFINVNKKFTLPNSNLKSFKSGDSVTLKELMKKTVAAGEIKIIPDRFSKIYFHWIDNLRDWCISRQIWFGHRLPVWYKDGEIIISPDSPGSDWQQDPDTLDTWFSSGLWTFSTLGWPNQNSPDLKTYHPTSVMETGYDILFFWVARMILMSTSLLGEVPFKSVYLHGLVRDAKGRKMSKSLNNGIDPLDMIAKYGADAVRLSLVIGTTPGNDTRLSEDKIRAYRNFATKIWNASRFVILNKPNGYNRQTAKLIPADQKYLDELKEIKNTIASHYKNFELHLAGEKAYHYFWHTFADKIIEEQKQILRSPDSSAESKNSAYLLLETILRQSLIILHPSMPFVTEAVYQKLRTNNDPPFLMVCRW